MTDTNTKAIEQNDSAKCVSFESINGQRKCFPLSHFMRCASSQTANGENIIVLEWPSIIVTILCNEAAQSRIYNLIHTLKLSLVREYEEKPNPLKENQRTFCHVIKINIEMAKAEKGPKP